MPVFSCEDCEHILYAFRDQSHSECVIRSGHISAACGLCGAEFRSLNSKIRDIRA